MPSNFYHMTVSVQSLSTLIVGASPFFLCFFFVVEKAFLNSLIAVELQCQKLTELMSHHDIGFSLLTLKPIVWFSTSRFWTPFQPSSVQPQCCMPVSFVFLASNWSAKLKFGSGAQSSNLGPVKCMALCWVVHTNSDCRLCPLFSAPFFALTWTLTRALHWTRYNVQAWRSIWKPALSWTQFPFAIWCPTGKYLLWPQSKSWRSSKHKLVTFRKHYLATIATKRV